MLTRGKFRLTQLTKYYHNLSAVEAIFEAVCNDGTPENDRFHRYTPNGVIKMTIDNPVVTDALELGKTYYVDFTPVE